MPVGETVGTEAVNYYKSIGIMNSYLPDYSGWDYTKH